MPLPPDFFRPTRDIVSPRQLYQVEHDNRLYNKDCVRRGPVLEGVTLNGLAGHTDIGEYGTIDIDPTRSELVFDTGSGRSVSLAKVTEHAGATVLVPGSFRREAAEVLSGIVYVPVSPWGETDIVYMNIDPAVNVAPHDNPRNVRYTYMRHQAGMIKTNRTDTGVGHWAICHSLSKFLDRGFQTIPWQHSHLWTFPKGFQHLSDDEIIEARAHQSWDEGLAQSMGRRLITEHVQAYMLPRYWPTGESGEDAMGAWVFLPGFTEQDFSQPWFIDGFWRDYSLAHNAIIGNLYEDIYRQPFDDLNNYIIGCLRTDTPIDWDQYEGFFVEYPDEPRTDQGRMWRDLKNRGYPMRRPPAWAGAIRFTDEGALIVDVIGTVNEEMGGIQALTYQIERPPQRLSRAQMAPLEATYRKLVYHALGADLPRRHTIYMAACRKKIGYLSADRQAY